LGVVVFVVFGIFITAREGRAGYGFCQLSFSSPHGTEIWVGDRVTWNLTSNVTEGKSFWFGTKNGVVDVNNTETGLGPYFSWQTDPYPADSVGTYTRYIVIKDLKIISFAQPIRFL